jgi:deoxyuridine 5'-triphosphate nucleotidohydrolase|tara:strand:- start:3093 stop:3536 length:444 start_codon:yes stop_codon:yes gene_type:complete
MEIPHLKIKKLHREAIIPCLGSKDSAGLDLFTLESVDIPSGSRALLHTGIAMSIPLGMVGLIWPRSKLAAKKGVATLAGVIDADYRGEVMISLLNTSDAVLELRKGDRVAQMILQQHYSWIPLEIVDDLEETSRGTSGINSSEMRLN